MKKTMVLLVSLLTAGWLGAADAVWEGDLAAVTLKDGKALKDISVKNEDGGLTVSATSKGSSVTYISLEIRVKPFVLGEKALALEAWSDAAKTTDAFYVRLQNVKGKNILSWKKWGAMLPDKPKYFEFFPGAPFCGMDDEPQEIKAPVTDPVARIVFYIGSRGDGKKMNLHLRNLKLVDPVRMPVRKGTKLVVRDSAKTSFAVNDNGTVYLDKYIPDNDVHYVFADLPFTGDLTGRKVVLEGSTDAPGVTGAFYLRGYNAKGECILSYKSWGGLLKAAPKTFTFEPGKSAGGLEWEPTVVKAGAGQKLAKLELIIGAARGNARKFIQAKFEKIRLE